MKLKMLGIITVSALLGSTLATTSVAQDRARGVDGARGAGQMRGAMAGPMAGQVRGQKPGQKAGQMHGQMRGGQRGAGGPGAAQPERFIERHDTDGDGKVSAAEFVDEGLAHVDELFEHRDANGDGLISADEHEAPRGPQGRPGRGPRGDRPARAEIDQDAVTACVRATIADFEPRIDQGVEDNFDNADTNGDGSLSLAEVSAAVSARAQERFDHLDDDGDGFVTAEELTANAEAQLAVRRTVRECIRAQLQD